MAEKEFLIFCDESESKGKFYSNFYGGLIVGATHHERITSRLNTKKNSLNLFGEVKWQKVTDRYLDKYVELMGVFFDEVHLGNLKIRIMFSQNAYKPESLSPDDHEMGYFKLYYQFIKHAFGLKYIEPAKNGTSIKLYFDQFPDTNEKSEQFRGFLLGLGSYSGFRDTDLRFARENITEIRSHDHVLLQCLDFVLGSMCFRLNDRHKDKLTGKNRRGK